MFAQETEGAIELHDRSSGGGCILPSRSTRLLGRATQSPSGGLGANCGPVDDPDVRNIQSKLASRCPHLDDQILGEPPIAAHGNLEWVWSNKFFVRHYTDQ
jgi:hypothetical protein